MIDIIIPCRNAPNVVSMMLTHLWCYGIPSGLVRSVTILDNVSTHPEMNAVLEVAARQLSCIVIRHEQNVGVWCSVNRGLSTVDGDLVLVLTSDVLIGPELLPTLYYAFRDTQCAFLGPDNGTMGLGQHARILTQSVMHAPLRIEQDYNGACWLMHWPRLRDLVGWYDPRFYICAGDIDYIERLRLKATEHQDGTLAPHVVRGLTICHLDKQTRRHDANAHGDATMEIEDLTRFRNKWLPTHPDIAARHPVPHVEQQIAYKAQQLGGWAEAKVG